MSLSFPWPFFSSLTYSQRSLLLSGHQGSIWEHFLCSYIHIYAHIGVTGHCLLYIYVCVCFIKGISYCVFCLVTCFFNQQYFLEIFYMHTIPFNSCVYSLVWVHTILSPSALGELGCCVQFPFSSLPPGIGQRLLLLCTQGPHIVPTMPSSNHWAYWATSYHIKFFFHLLREKCQVTLTYSGIFLHFRTWDGSLLLATVVLKLHSHVCASELGLFRFLCLDFLFYSPL